MAADPGKLSNAEAGLIVAGLILATAFVISNRWFGRTYWRVLGGAWGKSTSPGRGEQIARYGFVIAGVVMYAVGAWLLYRGS